MLVSFLAVVSLAGPASTSGSAVLSAGLPAGAPAATLGTVVRAAVVDGERRAAAGDVTGAVSDSASGKPLGGADVLILRSSQIVARTSTDPFGRYTLHNLPPGSYTVEVRLIGFRPVTKQIEIGPEGAGVELAFQLTPAPLELKAVEVSGAPVAVDTRTGNQVFKQDEFQGSPTLTTSQIVQQAIAGAARAPTGEVHIRGQHAEYTYYVDGVPVPPGISGSLNELFDPSIVNEIDFQTGGWDAEYGLRNAAIVNVRTRIPAGPFHADVSGYGGNFTSNGQTVNLSGNAGKWGFFASGTRQSTDLRREPVVADTNANGEITDIRNFSNHGNDLFGFGKAQYAPSDHDVVNLDVNWSRSRFQTPFDSATGIIDDRQQDVNGFVNLGWEHRVATGRTAGSQIFGAVFYRHGSLSYVPGSADEPSFTFAPDTTAYNIAEDRSFALVGVKADYLLRLSEQVAFKAGTLSSLVRGHENFSSFAANGTPGPASDSPLDGNDVALYVQTQLAPSEQWEFRAGVRYDNHHFPTSATEHANADQVSPRLRISFFPTPATTIWAYYGRLFTPTNTEDLRAITSTAQSGVATEPTLPERDHFFEVGVTHRFPVGIVAKLSAYHKRSSPGIDDTQVPGTAITTDVNIEQVRVTGIESVVEIRPAGPITGFLNLAIAHAYGYGAVTGGFFTVTPPAQTFDLDHDQRLSGTAGIVYSAHNLLITTTGIYGSGLTNGVTPNTPGIAGFDPSQASTGPLGTGLFDFNKEFKVDPSFILDASAGYTFAAARLLFRPQVFVDNVLNHKYSLKGTFFSGASFGRPRTVQFRLNVGV